MLDNTTLQNLAHNKEIDKYSLLREYLQIKFLNQFYKNKQLIKTYFKGGTAIKLIYNSSRFSEDLDFTTLMPLNKLKTILAKIVKELNSEFDQLTIKKLKTTQGYSAKLYLPIDFAPQPLTIKLDFSTRESILKPISSPLTTDLPIHLITIVDHLSKKELLAEKIRAILHRNKGRDVFDLWYLLHIKTEFQIKFINEKLKFYNESYCQSKLINKIKSFPQKTIDQDVRQFLPKSERKIIPELKRLILEKII
ncbi:MAG: nucleotidyl transferase AbiEii/AbiGii toxin family protein [Candidatus Beckwithbacteria bacterium]|nr:nucleotidyl transferase AbiEii/AbiGii toxin family protein [Patescibacteria group bacterium]